MTILSRLALVAIMLEIADATFVVDLRRHLRISGSGRTADDYMAMSSARYVAVSILYN
jgi:hypothetical protein